MQLGLSESGFDRTRGATRRQVFLAEMDRVVPWSGLKDLIHPHDPAFGRGRQPYPLASMLRIHLMQQWFGYADQAMAHIGADLESGLVHTVVSTTAKAADSTQLDALLHGAEGLVMGDGG